MNAEGMVRPELRMSSDLHGGQMTSMEVKGRRQMASGKTSYAIRHLATQFRVPNSCVPFAESSRVPCSEFVEFFRCVLVFRCPSPHVPKSQLRCSNSKSGVTESHVQVPEYQASDLVPGSELPVAGSRVPSYQVPLPELPVSEFRVMVYESRVSGSEFRSRPCDPLRSGGLVGDPSSVSQCV